MPAGGPHVRPPALLLCGDNLRSLLHDRHSILVLLLAGPQSGKFSPLIGWRRIALLLIGQRNTIYVPCSMTGSQGSKSSPLIGWRRNVLLLIGQRNTIYVPCSMTVTVSWFSFWLDHKAVSPPSHWLAQKCLASHWPEEHNLRSLLHDRHCLLVLFLAGPQGGKCSPLIG